MLNSSLIQPLSIAVIGASNNLGKPGGGLVRNLLKGNFNGNVYPVNPKENVIQGLKAYNTLDQLPNTDLAILAIKAEACIASLEFLAKNKATKAFIIISAGFSEIGEEGKKLEESLKLLANKYQLAIIGPNCIGVMNTNYQAVFVSPPPPVIKKGVDFVSASGALAVFLFEPAARHGLKFGSVFTVGNSTTIGVEEVLEYWDNEFDLKKSSTLKMVYVEQIRKPDLFFKHIQSLRSKGCDVIVTKPGESEAGARAALSHTGALIGDSEAFNMLIEKAGAIQCYSREELINIACILNQKILKGNKLAIITHAGGPAVMLSDCLQKAGFSIPEIDKETRQNLLSILYPGSSATNPIDMLATANREQLVAAIDVCDKLNYIDGMIVIYGKTGMEDLFQTYKSLSDSIENAEKPVYTIMPSVNSGEKEIISFIETGKTTFFDEVVFAKALDLVWHAPKLYANKLFIPTLELEKQDGVEDKPLNEEETLKRLKWAGIPHVRTEFIYKQADISLCNNLNYPLVAKVIGILHKTEVDGVILNISTTDELTNAYNKLVAIHGAKGMLVQEMMQGTELYLGAKMHTGIGYSIHIGVGGIFLELINDISARLAPIDINEAHDMLSQLKSQKIFKGFRNMPPVSADSFAQLIHTFSNIFRQYPDIREIDLNPLIANGEHIMAVDARIIV
jgi:acetate---CoA ligase (ADP-forming)